MAQEALQPAGGAILDSTLEAIDGNFSQLFGGLFRAGNVYYCDYANGSDNNDGLTAATATQTLSAAYGLATSGNNDVIVLVGNGAANGSQRLSAAFTWAKNATHLLGVTAPVLYSQRARIAPTAAVTAFTPFFTISGNGCIFENIQWFHGFDTGTTAQINMVLTGSRNFFRNCHIAGMGDAASAQDAGSRSLKIGSSGSGENVFESCVIGIDTVTRTAANASIEFTAATTRNVFRNCLFPFMTSAATPLGYIGSASGCMDRHQVFENCSFINAIKSTSTTMDALGTLAASAGGLLLFKNSTLVGITEFGTDATTRALCYVDGGAPTAATSGIAVNPT